MYVITTPFINSSVYENFRFAKIPIRFFNHLYTWRVSPQLTPAVTPVEYERDIQWLTSVLNIMQKSRTEVIGLIIIIPVASSTKEVNSRLTKCPLIFTGRLANCGFTSLVKEATGPNVILIKD